MKNITRGIDHIGVTVPDIEEAANRFVDAGGELLNDPGELLGDVEDGTGHFVYGRTP